MSLSGSVHRAGFTALQVCKRLLLLQVSHDAATKSHHVTKYERIH